MENIYEWLYDHYCRPYQENVRAPFASHIQSAEQLLIRGGGTALEGDTITVSAGKIGYQICCKPEDLIALVGAQVADVV